MNTPAMELKQPWNKKMPCGHLRQYGTLGEYAPVHCLACENANLNATIEQQAATLRVMNDALKEAHRIFGNIGHSQVVQRRCPDFAEVAEKVRKAHDPHA